jgi:hypothetical protein
MFEKRVCSSTILLVLKLYRFFFFWETLSLSKFDNLIPSILTYLALRSDCLTMA